MSLCCNAQFCDHGLFDELKRGMIVHKVYIWFILGDDGIYTCFVYEN